MMANLNFQQPPRSIANSFSSRNNQFIQQNQSTSNSTTPNNNNNGSGISSSNSVISSLMASSANNSSSLTTTANSNSSSLSGHVTPTAMFNNGGSDRGGGGGGGGGGGIGQQQQMPIGGPNNPQGSGQSGSGGGGQNNSLLGYRSYSNFSQVNNARSSSMPNNSNMNKSILNRTTGPFGLVGGGGGAGGLQNYQSGFGGIGVGMVKQQQSSEQSEFQMSSEDFPALPGTQHQHQSATSVQQQQQQADVGSVSSASGLLSGNSGGALGNIGDGSSHNGGGLGGTTTNGAGARGVGSAMMGMELQGGGAGGSVSGSSEDKHQQQLMMKRNAASSGGVQTSPDGKVTNIPASMVNNQYGMVGLLTFIRESDPNLVSLAMGQDLTTLGLNLNSSENLYPSFGGPFADQPCRPQDIDFNVPPEYLVNMSIRDKLSPIQLKKYKDDLLFFLFYTNVGDAMQLMVAEELQSRDWMYHIDEKVWITRMPGHPIFEKNGTTERGVFYHFDAQNWRRVTRDAFLDTGKLASTSTSRV